MPSAFALATRVGISDVACNTENCVCTCRCVKGLSFVSITPPGVDFLAPLAIDAWTSVSRCAKLASASIGASYSTSSEEMPGAVAWIFCVINPKKQRAVAATSYAASWASPNPSPKSFWCNSVRVGHLNLPPFPPGSAQNWVEMSLVSSSAMPSKGMTSAPRRYSEPTTWMSNPILWPTRYLDWMTSSRKICSISLRSCPSSKARLVEMPCTFSALKGIVKPSGRMM